MSVIAIVIKANVTLITVYIVIILILRFRGFESKDCFADVLGRTLR